MRNEPLKAFNVDFNWVNGRVAKDGVFVGADPERFVDFHRQMNANAMWTFAVTFNGYAWYPSKFAPMLSGLSRNFLTETVRFAHRAGMEVFAYLCAGSNPYLERRNPKNVRRDEPYFRMPFSKRYLEYLSGVIGEIAESGADGIAVDWLRYPRNRRTVWVPDEREMFVELTGERFPACGEVTGEDLIQFERLSLERAWRSIRDAAGPMKIWTNQPFDFADDPVWTGHVIIAEADYVLNEGPNFDLLNWLYANKGEHTTVVQNLCGWDSHDLSGLSGIDGRKFGFFGFAAADPETCLPERRISETNWKNIEIIRSFYGKELR